MRAAPAPAPAPAPIAIASDALGRLMPLHLLLGRDGCVRGAGPTLTKLFPPGGLLGHCLFDLFALQRPRGVDGPAGLPALPGARLKLALRDPPHTAFRGFAVEVGMGDGDPGVGLLLNLSFGIGVPAAVREHRLTDTDFAVTDLAVELLYLIEAKSAVLAELRRLNLRLQSAKTAAEEQAITDPLTGLRNRRALDAALRGVAAAGRRFSLMHIDLDYFKQINDGLGHAAGDHVLAEVARLLQAEVRAGDTVARVGGDEFVLLLPELACAEALDRIAHRILERVEQPIDFEGHPCRISASIGTVMAGDDATVDPDRLLCDLDRALYASKRAGRGRVTAFCEDLPLVSDDTPPGETRTQLQSGAPPG